MARGKRAEAGRAAPYSFFLFFFLFLADAGYAQQVSSVTGWRCVSSENVQADGEAISQAGFNDSSWYDADPDHAGGTTVFAALLAAGEYGGNKGVFVEKTLAQVNASRFSLPWWYRAELPEAATLGPPLLDFHGLNYRADVFVDGAQVAGADEIVGPFRRFILPLAQSPRPNAAVAVRVWRQHDRALPPRNNDTDLGISFVDWAPAPPDGNFGLFRPVQLLSVASADVRILLDYLAVAVTLVSPVEAGAKEANLSLEVSITAYNFEEQSIRGRMDITIAGVQVTVEHVAIPPSPHGVTLVFNRTHAPRLANVGPLPLWWPWRMGAQTFVNGSASFSAASVSDEGPHASADAVLGLRQASAILDDQGNRLFYINGHRFMVYGGGYSPDLFLRRQHSWQARHLRMARDLGLNALRLEGKMEDDAFYGEADRLGLLVLTGWCCCDAWQHWPLWHSEQYHVANASLQTQIRRLRTHSSAIAFLYGSDEAPPPHVEDSFLAIFREEGWRAATLAAASALSTPGAGPTGVKMAGPYAWVPPNYWEEGAATGQLGGAFGFSTEISPGAAPLLLDAATRYLGQDHLWPVDDVWDYHCGSEQGLFGSLGFFQPPLLAHYGNISSAAAFLSLSQAQAYDAHRAMFESYAAFKYHNATGVVQWMLNNAFPSMIWHLWDYDHVPGGSYFGVKAALCRGQLRCTTDDNQAHVVLLPASKRLVAVNHNLMQATAPSFLSVSIYTVGGERLADANVSVPQIPADGTISIGSAEGQFDAACRLDASQTLLVRLDAASVISDYWMPCQPDVLNWTASTFYVTPCARFSNMSDLRYHRGNPVPSQLTLVGPGPEPGEQLFGLNVTNVGQGTAPWVELSLVQANGSVVRSGVHWSDNFVTLVPGETRRVLVAVPHEAPPLLARASALPLL